MIIKQSLQKQRIITHNKGVENARIGVKDLAMGKFKDSSSSSSSSSCSFSQSQKFSKALKQIDRNWDLKIQSGNLSTIEQILSSISSNPITTIVKETEKMSTMHDIASKFDQMIDQTEQSLNKISQYLLLNIKFAKEEEIDAQFQAQKQKQLKRNVKQILKQRKNKLKIQKRSKLMCLPQQLILQQKGSRKKLRIGKTWSQRDDEQSDTSVNREESYFSDQPVSSTNRVFNLSDQTSALSLKLYEGWYQMKQNSVRDEQKNCKKLQ